jgi:hypothetical protein
MEVSKTSLRYIHDIMFELLTVTVTSGLFLCLQPYHGDIETGNTADLEESKLRTIIQESRCAGWLLDGIVAVSYTF